MERLTDPKEVESSRKQVEHSLKSVGYKNIPLMRYVKLGDYENVQDQCGYDIGEAVHGLSGEILRLKDELKAYQDTGLTPQNIICREDDIKLLQGQNKEFREEILKLREELAKKTQWTDLYFGQLRNANERIKRDEDTEKELQQKCDYWELEAKKWCDQLGEIRILATQELCDK